MILEIYTYTKDVRRTSPVTGKPYGARKPLTLRSFHRIPDRVEDDPDNRLLTETRCEPEPIRVIAPGARFLDTPGPTLILTARGEKLTADVALCAARAGLKGLRIDLGPDRSQALPPGRDRILSVILGPPPAEPTAPTTQTGFDWAEPEPKPQALPPGRDRILSVILGPPPAEPPAPTTQTGFDWAEPEPKRRGRRETVHSDWRIMTSHYTGGGQ